MSMTEHLYRCQSNEIPVSLSTIVAAVLLQQRGDTLRMKDLLWTIRIIFNYIKMKANCNLVMSLPPQQPLVEKHVTGLGFKMKNAGKKDCAIYLSQTDDSWRRQLTLAHYSLGLSSIFVLEYSFAHIVNNHFNVLKSDKPLKAEALFEAGQRLADMFSKEHMVAYKFDFATLQNRLAFFN